MSRKITQQIVEHFLNAHPKTIGNSTVSTDGNNTMLYLHGKLIAKSTHEGLFISNGGWSSNVTKERLNGLPNVSVTQKNFVWYLNGKEWDSKLIKVEHF